METEELLLKYLADKDVFIWGTGKGSEKVIAFMQTSGVNSYRFIDKDKSKQFFLYMGKTVCDPKRIKMYSEKNYIIIACSDYKEIEWELESYGYKKYINYIDGFNFDNSILEMKYRQCGNVEFVKRLTLKDFVSIEKEMEKAGLNLVSAFISNKPDKLAAFEKSLGFETFYSKDRNISYQRKILEYWMAYQLLGIEEYGPEDQYLDVGSSSTPWAMYLRKKMNIKAFGIDLIENPLHKDYYLVGDATNTPFTVESVKGISLQSSFCLFEHNGDIKLLEECSRILQIGGKLVISPLYMYPEYISAVSAVYYGKGYNDTAQKEVIRNDCPCIRMSRYYDVQALEGRILSLCESLHLNYKIHVLPNEGIPPYEFAYLKFILEFEKI